MFRIFSRIAAVAVVLSLSLLVVSPAQAAPLGGTRWISKMPVRWTDAALGWLSSLFTGSTPAPVQQTMEKGNGNGNGGGLSSGGSGGGWTATPQTGSCIDPLGNPCTVDPEP
jgi:hypothetical protein